MKTRFASSGAVRRCRLLLLLAGAFAGSVAANTTPQTLPFSQDWTNTSLLSVTNDWSAIPGIVGHRGDNLTGGTGTDPQTLLQDDTAPVLSVSVNQTAPDTFNTGGTAEFELADPVVALTGSGTADAPYLLVSVATTGLTSIRVQYNIRDLDGSADNAVQAVALHYRVGTTGAFTNVPAAFVADATSGPSLATLVTPVDVTLPAAADNNAVVQLRIMTTNAAGNDEWVGIDDISVSGTSAGSTPVLSVADASAVEDSASGELVFTVSLSAPATSAVTFDAATSSTAQDTATPVDDYTPVTTSGSIAIGASSTTISVPLIDDALAEGDETFTITLSNPANATLGTATAQGTIVDDEIPVSSIPAIQGTGVCSPLVPTCSSAAIQGDTARTEGNIVTAVGADGFAMQDPVGDGNPATSDGIYVFTLAAPLTDDNQPIAVGDVVNVTGRVDEYFYFTELSVNTTRSDTMSIVRTAQGEDLPLPVMFELDGENGGVPSLDPAALYCGSVGGVQNNFECLEGMLVSIPDGIVTNGNQRYSSPVVDDYAQVHIGPHGNRALREPNLRFGLTPGAGNSAAIVADGNPEVLEMDADKFLAVPFGTELVGGAKFSGTGVIGYSFSDYEFWPATLDIDDATNVLPRPVPTSVPATLTVGSFNVLRLCNISDDEPGGAGFTCDGNAGGPGGEPTQEELDAKIEKVGTYVVDVLRSPDVLGLQEVETLAVLESLASWIASNGGPAYDAYLLEGHDVGGIDVGYLVNPARVSGAAVSQLRFDEVWDDPNDGETELHDRPPLLLQGEFLSPAGGRAMPFAVINNHLRSRGGVDTSNAAGERVRAKRFLQAKAVAEEAQAFQTANPATPLVLVGDYNSFQFSDGFVDMVGLIAGIYDDAKNTCAPANAVTTCDLVTGNITNPPLVVGVELADENERYSYEFTDNLGNIQGQARDPSSHQTIDHVMFAQSVLPLVADVAFGRANSDASIEGYETGTGPDGLGGTQTSLAIGSSDHDGVVAFISTDCSANPAADGDGDGICDLVDNCPLIGNPTQDDSNDDGIGDACNSAPTFTSAAVTAATQDAAYTYAVTTADADGNVLVLTAPVLPAWLVLTDNGDGTATLAGTPGNADVGVHDVTLRANDGTTTADQVFQITVADVNEAPVFGAASYTFDVRELASVGTEVGSVSATDPDAGDTLEFAITDGNTGSAFAIDVATGEITVAASSALVAETVFTLEVTVEDAGGLMDTVSVEISVTDLPDAIFADGFED